MVIFDNFNCIFTLFFKFTFLAWNNELARLESQLFERNAIGVDWGRLSRCSYRYATDFLVPQIGYRLRALLQDVLQIDLRQTNCVGHSLGNNELF